jgi:hypothetical protein
MIDAYLRSIRGLDDTIIILLTSEIVGFILILLVVQLIKRRQ